LAEAGNNCVLIDVERAACNGQPFFYVLFSILLA